MGRITNPRSSSKKDLWDRVGLGGAIKFMTQGCLDTKKIKQRNVGGLNIHPQETSKHHRHHHHHHHKVGLNYGHKKSGRNQPVTLEEWIMRSPHNKSFEVDVLKMQGSKPPVSRKVHPSLDRTSKKDRQFSEFKQGFAGKRTPADVVVGSSRGGNNDEEEDEDDSFTFSTSQISGTLKKRVSFKEPEVANIFILKESTK